MSWNRAEEAGSEGIGLELDMDEADEIPGDTAEDPIMDNADLSMDLNDGLDIADNLVLSEDTEAQETAPT